MAYHSDTITKVGHLETKNCWCTSWQEGCALLLIVIEKFFPCHRIVSFLLQPSKPHAHPSSSL